MAYACPKFTLHLPRYARHPVIDLTCGLLARCPQPYVKMPPACVDARGRVSVCWRGVAACGLQKSRVATLTGFMTVFLLLRRSSAFLRCELP